MSKSLSHESGDFDCSAYLSHGLRWSVNGVHNGFKGSMSNSRIANMRERNTQYAEYYTNESVTVRDWDVLLQEEMSTVAQKEKGALLQKDISQIFGTEKNEKFLEKDYYESEYNTLVKWIDEEEIIVPPPSMFADKREEIQRISLVADETLGSKSFNSNYHSYDRHQTHEYIVEDIANEVITNANETPQTPGSEVLSTNVYNYNFLEHNATCEDLEREVAINAYETPQSSARVMSPGGFKSFIKQQLVGFGNSENKEDGELRKRRLCRHFVKGFCSRGECCEFLHDPSIYCSDDQKVFLGGLPSDITPQILKDKLEDQGLTVLNRPKIMRGFTPQVCLGSIEQAEKLIASRFLYIDEHRVDVRPYQDREQLRKGLPSVVKRSVFLGGLPESTTGEMIIDDLRRLDVKVVNFPVVKNGYAPRVVLESLEHAKMLVSLKRVIVNGTVVDVRPYVNFRKRY